MKRHAIKKLVSWKSQSVRKPLLLLGARQVGKTWLLNKFGEKHYADVAYFLFDNQNVAWNKIFGNTTSPSDIIDDLSALHGKSIVPGKTLVIFDEIQEYSPALQSLKYFYEKSPEFHIVSAGSTLGTSLHSMDSFPVGKVDFEHMYPLSFAEFVEQSLGGKMLKLIRLSKLDSFPYHDKLMRAVNRYYFVGGMPEVVSTYLKSADYEAVTNVQEDLIASYLLDFSKYANTAEFAEKLRMLWRSVPSQLAKENKKFIYGALKHGARAKDFETAIQWLSDSSLIHKVHRVTKPEYSLNFHEDFDAFKIFMSDTGLFSRRADLTSAMIVSGNRLLTEFKGALSEQFVHQQLVASGVSPLYYWSSERATSEIDFLTQDSQGNVIPIEVKSGMNLRAKSLKTYIDKYNPAYSIRISASRFKYDEQNRIYDIPLYAIHVIPELLKRHAQTILLTFEKA